MNCPHKDCRSPMNAAAGPVCPECGRGWKVCPGCGRPSLPFAQFCRICGAVFPAWTSDWGQRRGGPGRLACTAASPGALGKDGVRELKEFRLESPARWLLAVDGHLLAGSEEGEVLMVRLPGLRPELVRRFNLAKAPTTYPAIWKGRLLAGADDSLLVYPLGLMYSGAEARPSLVLELAAPATGDILALSSGAVILLDWQEGMRQAVWAGGLDGSGPELRSIGGRMPQMAAPVAAAREDGWDVILMRGWGGQNLEVALWRLKGGVVEQPRFQPVAGNLGGLLAGAPAAMVQGSVMAIFDGGRRLRTLDPEKRRIIRIIKDGGVQNMAGTGPDRLGVTTLEGVYFTWAGRMLNLPHDQSPSGNLLMVRDCCLAAALANGVVRLFDLDRPGETRDWKAAGGGESITSMAACLDKLIVATDGGAVRIAALPLAGSAHSTELGA